MAVITPVPLFIKDCLVQIGTDSYEKAVSAVSFVPSSTVQTFEGLSPDATYTDVSPATWTCQLTYVQDWDTAGSLANYLHEHEGETVTMTFEPITDGATVTADIVIAAGQIGGQKGGATTATVTLGVSGKPVITPAA